MLSPNQSSRDQRYFLRFWNKWWQLAGGKASLSLQFGQEIFDLYANTDRLYHNDKHPLNMWELFEIHQDLAANQSAICLAIAGHDVIYDPFAKDNEERSAVYLEQMMLKGGIDSALVSQAKRLILATKEHQPADQDEALLIDLDLAILSQSSEVYQAYAQAIRQEYSAYNNAEFAAGRSKFLQSMLERKSIYHTDAFKSAYEQQARHNLERELRELKNAMM